MENLINMSHLAGAIIYSVIGCIGFAVAFKVVDVLTPHDMWNEIFEEHNNALAIIIGCLAIGMSIIIAAAIRG
jgi:putative membrane protein